MKRLFTIDLKDYNPNGKKFYRPSVRGIIFDDNGNIAMIYSQKYHFYKFPVAESKVMKLTSRH